MNKQKNKSEILFFSSLVVPLFGGANTDHIGKKTGGGLMCKSHFYRYSFEANEMEHKCICCHEKRSHTVKVDLVCSEHKTIEFSYVHVDECGCMETKCPKRRT